MRKLVFLALVGVSYFCIGGMNSSSSLMAEPKAKALCVSLAEFLDGSNQVGQQLLGDRSLRQQELRRLNRQHHGNTDRAWYQEMVQVGPSVVQLSIRF